nr:hypothetical protein [uncultured Terrisporobacter sp.]
MGTAIDIAMCIVGTSIGDIIAKALDYMDPMWGYRRNNKYILN